MKKVKSLMMAIAFLVTLTTYGCGGGGGGAATSAINQNESANGTQAGQTSGAATGTISGQIGAAAFVQYDSGVSSKIANSGSQSSYTGQSSTSLINDVSVMPGVASVDSSTYSFSVTYKSGGRHTWIIGDALTSSSASYKKAAKLANDYRLSARVLLRRTGNRQAVLINAIADDPGFEGAKQPLSDIKSYLTQAGYQVTEKNGQDAGVDFFRSELANYSVIVILAHGGTGGQNTYFDLQTGQPYNNDDTKYWNDISAGRIVRVTINCGSYLRQFRTKDYWGITDKFIQYYYGSSGKQMPSSIVYNGACSGMKYDVMAKALINSGAGVYLGWTEEQGISMNSASILIADMLDGDNVGAAYNHLSSSDRTDTEYGNAELKYYPETGYDFQIVDSSIETWVSPPTVTLSNGKGDAVISCPTSTSGAIIEASCNNSDSWKRLVSQKALTCTYNSAGTYYPICRLKNSNGDVLSQSVSSVTVKNPDLVNLYISTTGSDGSWTSSVTGSQGKIFYMSATGLVSGGGISRHIIGKDGIDYEKSHFTADAYGYFTQSWTSTCSSIVQSYDIWIVDDATGRQSNHVTENITVNNACSAVSLQMSSSSANGPWATSVSNSQNASFFSRGTGLTPNGGISRYIIGKDGINYEKNHFTADANGNFTQSWTSTCNSIVESYDIWIVDDATGRQSNHVTENITSNASCVSGGNGSSGTTFGYPVSPYGPITLGFYSDGIHLGEDIMLNEGTPIQAVADGRVIYYGAADGYGELVVGIDHDLNGWHKFNLTVGHVNNNETNHIVSIYGHLRKSQVRGGQELGWQYGDQVKKGDVIGYINDTAHNGGYGPHLHFGCRLTGETPGQWILWGRSTPSYPQSDVRFYAAYSEIIKQLP